jgi:sugar-specific transcriptional regulator TrmB
MKKEKIDITLNQEDVQNIIDCYEKDIELIEKLKERNKIYKTTIKGQHKTIIELRSAKKASKKVHKERNKKLKEENEQLKERIEYLERSNDRREETIISLRDEIIELEEKMKETINNINVTISIIKQRPSKDEGLDFYIISKLESFVKTLKEKK